MEHLEADPLGVYTLTTRSITVLVEPEFLDEQSDPEEHRFVWAYHVRIENHGTQTVQLKSRYWRITDELGQVQEVAGAGVIGEQPLLAPGESFEYTSGTPLGTAIGHHERALRDGSGNRRSIRSDHPGLFVGQPV